MNNFTRCRICWHDLLTYHYRSIDKIVESWADLFLSSCITDQICWVSLPSHGCNSFVLAIIALCGPRCWRVVVFTRVMWCTRSLAFERRSLMFFSWMEIAVYRGYHWMTMAPTMCKCNVSGGRLLSMDGCLVAIKTHNPDFLMNRIHSYLRSVVGLSIKSTQYNGYNSTETLLL